MSDRIAPRVAQQPGVASHTAGVLSLRLIALGLCFSILWSSAFTTARFIVLDAPPYLSLAVRFAIAGLIGIVIAFALGQRAAFSGREWLAIVVLGVCQNTIYLGFCFLAVQWIDVSIVVVIASLLPLIVAGAQWLLFGERLGWYGVAALALGLCGVAVIMVSRIQGGADPVGIVVTLLGVLALAGATLLVGKSLTSNRNLLMIVGLQMLIGACTTLPYSVLFETWQINWSSRLIVAFAWITLMPGLLATYLWFLLLRQIGAVRAAAFHFLNPFFGVAIAAALLGERLTATDVVAVVVIMISILAVQLSRLR